MTFKSVNINFEIFQSISFYKMSKIFKFVLLTVRNFSPEGNKFQQRMSRDYYHLTRIFLIFRNVCFYTLPERINWNVDNMEDKRKIYLRNVQPLHSCSLK